MPVIKTVTIPSPISNLAKIFVIEVDDWVEVFTVSGSYFYFDIVHAFNSNAFILDAHIMRDGSAGGEQALVGNQRIDDNTLRVVWNERKRMKVIMIKLTDVDDFFIC